jgi:uncharacterized membrane protein YhdT
MRKSVLPTTRLGKWSYGLAISFIVAFLIFMAFTEFQTGFNGLPSGFNQTLADIIAIGLVCISLATIITGLISMIKHKEKSVLVIIGMMITFWLGLLGSIGQYLI